MRARGGFSLVELLLVVALAAVMIAGLASLQGAIVRQNGALVQEILVRDQADYARRIIQRTLAEATVLKTPMLIAAAKSTSDEVAGWTNLSPLARSCNPNCIWTATQLIGTSTAIKYFRFCKNSRGQLVRYWGVGVSGTSLYIDTSVCGTAPRPGDGMEIIAGQPVGKVLLDYAGASTPYIFERPANVPNVVRAVFKVTAKGKQGFSVDAVANVDMSVGLLAPFQ